MIKELSDLGKRLRNEQNSEKLIHDAIKDEPIGIDLIISYDGSFNSFQVYPKRMTPAETITAKKGKARLLVDKAGEVLCYDEKNQTTISQDTLLDEEQQKDENFEKSKAEPKHQLFIAKLNAYKFVDALKPVFLFYFDNKENGIEKAIKSFATDVEEKVRASNISFRVVGEDTRINEKKEVLDAIISVFEESQMALLDNSKKKCSLCGLFDYPVIDKPHGSINGVPGGLPAGNVLVSYNENAFESYGLKGNENSSICTNCARTYVESLKWLLNNGHETVEKGKNGKEKLHFRYTNRKKVGADTTVVYWTRENRKLDELDLLENPDAEQVGILIDSVVTGKVNVGKSIIDDQFYSCTLSGAAARIAVRDWIELSIGEFKANIAKWFEDISIFSFGQKHYPTLYWLARAGHNTKSDNDPSATRIATYLWNSALKKTNPPMWILNTVLKRLRFMETAEEGNENQDPMTRERAALIRLILNRNKKEGGSLMGEKLDESNVSPAYVCGQIFAVLVDIQRAAMGKDINAGIRERFFSFASSTPASAFGRLMKMSQNHLSKIKGERPGIAYVLDRELQQLNSRITEVGYPKILTLEEQGQFALGYYHKKQETWEKAQANKELREAIADEEANK